MEGEQSAGEGLIMGDNLRELFQRKVLLFDGGMGTMLISAGLKMGQPPEEWNLKHPRKVKEVHRKYFQAGAEVVQTNTFGATGLKLSASSSGMKGEVDRINREAVNLVREVMDELGEENRFVAGDIGPTGQFFPPVGSLKPERARRTFREQASALEQEGVDLFLIETMYDIREAVEALRAIREVSNKPVVAEMTFDRKPNGYFTMMGNTPEEAVEVLPGEGADVIGANCSVSSSDMMGLASLMRELAGEPLLFQPNAGSPEMKRGREVYRQKPDEFAADMEKIVREGANAVGGCCGTTPEFIKQVHLRLVEMGRR